MDGWMRNTFVCDNSLSIGIHGVCVNSSIVGEGVRVKASPPIRLIYVVHRSDSFQLDSIMLFIIFSTTYYSEFHSEMILKCRKPKG